MVFRWLTIGVAIGAALYAYQNPTSIPLSSSEASLRLREFWHRTFLFHQGSPYEGGLFEQSHIKQHPPPKDALSPAVAKKQAEEAAVREARLARARQAVPTYFISHGSPPNMVQPESLQYRAWQSVGREILDLKPKAIVVASPYWLGAYDRIQVNTGDNNDIIHECCGFPDEYYKQEFQSKPDTALAERIISLLKEKKVKAEGEERGLDHGVWAPFRVMFGESTDIPIVQVTIPYTGAAKDVLKMGNALQSLRSERIVIIGVGMTAHNRQQIDKYDINNPAPYAKEYSKRIVSAIADYTGKNRETRLRQYTFHPDFRNAHPTPEHLWPLCFAVGAAGDDEGEVLFSMLDGSMAWGNYRFGPTDQVM